jgi:mannose-6-phosphate isomerase-like protein (cupin superfamily)
VHEAINIGKKFELFSELWSPKIIAQMNDYHFKLARLKGDFVWHDHPDTDEVFLVIKGKMRIHFRDGSVELCSGEMFAVPRGIEHMPSATNECLIMIIEPDGVVNTGNAGGNLTAENNVWI